MIRKKTGKKPGPGRPPLTGEAAPAALIGVKCSRGLLARIDAWRTRQDEKPTRSAAVRRLTEMGLDSTD